MTIWIKRPSLEELRNKAKGTLIEQLGIEYLEIGDNFLRARMPVDHRTIQPAGILHGGASVVLAETLGSVSAACCLDRNSKQCVGLEINANHIRSISHGFVYGTSHPIHLGKSTQLWEINIHNEQNQLVCVSRLTMAILDRKP